MTFCSIEEAWGTNFSNDKNNIDIYSNLQNDNSPSNESYQTVELPQRYNKHHSNLVKSNLINNDKKISRNLFKRTMHRLPHHIGSSSRYINNNKTQKLNFINNINSNKSPKKEMIIDNNPTYHNSDTSINEYDRNMENTILKDEINKDLYNIRNVVQEETYYPNNSDYDTEIVNIEHEDDNISYKNKKSIDDTIENLVDGSSSNNEIHNIIIYIITGIFIIFILDIFTKLGKNSK